MTYNLRNGNMYPWVDGTHCHHRGGCPHGCTYCYVQHMRCARFYQGPIRLVDKELREDYYKFGKGKTIFIDHMIDLFAEDMPEGNIERVLAHCREYPENQYVFQTKNPSRVLAHNLLCRVPEQAIFGTTIETNDVSILQGYSKAPAPIDRACALSHISGAPTFLTIEPIMKFNLQELVRLVARASPSWVNIGADSKHQNLPEPSYAEVEELTAEIWHLGIEVREKSNLDRLKV